MRGRPLQPVWNYARWIAKDRDTYEGVNGSELGASADPYRAKGLIPSYRQIALWRTEGGSVYDVIPPVHMARVREMGRESLQEAELAMKTVKKNKNEAQVVLHFMKAYQLLSDYYERKVAAAVAALIYKDSHQAEDRAEAEKLADEAVEAFVAAADYMQEHLDPVMHELHGEPIKELGGKALPGACSGGEGGTRTAAPDFQMDAIGPGAANAPAWRKKLPMGGRTGINYCFSPEAGYNHQPRFGR